jgi:hypothetical protein
MKLSKILLKHFDVFYYNNKFCENCKHFIKIDNKNLLDINQCSKFKKILNDKTIINSLTNEARDNINLCGPSAKHFKY